MVTSRRLLLAITALILLGLAVYLAAWSRDHQQTLRGHLRVAPEGTTFSQCDTGKVWVIVDATGKRLPEITKKFQPPGEPIYVEVDTRSLPASRLGIIDVHYAARETRGCRDNLSGVTLRALGTEPFWAVTVSANEIRFEAPDEPGRVIFPPVKPRGREEQVYETRSDRGDRLKIQVRKEPCSDGMSDAYYSLAAKVEINGREFNGCGRPGWTEP